MSRSHFNRSMETKAFVVRSTDYGEADRVLHLLTLERGKISVLAKSARRSRRRFGAALSPYTLISAQVRRRRAGLWLLEEATVIETYPTLTSSLSRMALAGYFTELARDTVPDGKPEPEIFDLLLSAFRILDKVRPNRSMVRAFELNLLHRLGLSPQLHRCTGPGCGRVIPPATSPQPAFSTPTAAEQRPLRRDIGAIAPYAQKDRAEAQGEAAYGLSPALGGILCQHCASQRPSIPLTSESVADMVTLSQMGIAEAALLSEDLSEEANEQIKAAVAPILLDLVGHTLKSVDFINQLQNIRAFQDGGRPHGGPQSPAAG